jgi:hypothetical protein
MRMIRQEARTSTIQAWTGLSGDRIRKLHRQYVFEEDARSRRHRGKSPATTSFFLSNRETRRQSVALGGLYALLGLLGGRSDPVEMTRQLPPWAEQFCDAYETYLTLGIGSSLTFEHAALLLDALRRRNDLAPGRCRACEGFTIVDLQRQMAPQCPCCDVLNAEPTANDENAPSARRRRRQSRGTVEAPTGSPERAPERLRRSLSGT